ncbi:MAG: hypothetical protein ACRD15_16935 [Vicinamibacterales bacterium]
MVIAGIDADPENADARITNRGTILAMLRLSHRIERTLLTPSAKDRARGAPPPSPCGVIVNENFVRAYLPPGRDPIGAPVVGNRNMTFDIVGVVKDSASIGLRDPDQHMLYVPHGQGVLHVRSVAAPASLTASIEAAVRRHRSSVTPIRGTTACAGPSLLGDISGVTVKGRN